MTTSRRSLMRTIAMVTTAIGLTSVMTACAVTTNGTVTTVTLNVAKIDAYGKAIQAAGSALLVAPAIATLLGPNVATAQLVLAGVTNGITAFDKACNGATSVSLDTSGVAPAVNSIVQDAQSLLSKIQTALAGQPATNLTTDIQNYIASLQTITALLQAMMVPMSMSAPKTPLTEAQALAVVGIHLPN